jgi:hypothetical protein
VDSRDSRCIEIKTNLMNRRLLRDSLTIPQFRNVHEMAPFLRSIVEAYLNGKSLPPYSTALALEEFFNHPIDIQLVLIELLSLLGDDQFDQIVLQPLCIGMFVQLCISNHLAGNEVCEGPQHSMIRDGSATAIFVSRTNS